MPKAIAVQAVFLIAVIAIFLFFLVGIFWGWINTIEMGTSQATCSAKRIGYCTEWATNKKEPTWWFTKEPLDCARENIGISKPSCTECKSIAPNIQCP